MGFKYLNGASWLDVTREERVFCSFLYWDIRRSEGDFVRWLNENSELHIEVPCDWEVGYEVCFYRDLLRSRGLSAHRQRFSPKRTFDLCLFSEDCIVIIEAKAHQRFDCQQIIDFEQDRIDIPKATGRTDIRVAIIALCSSYYFDNLTRYGRHGLLDSFDHVITWEQMHRLYQRDIYLRANETYKK